MCTLGEGLLAAYVNFPKSAPPYSTYLYKNVFIAYVNVPKPVPPYSTHLYLYEKCIPCVCELSKAGATI